MIKAILKGKLSSTTENMEDILTSNIFSIFSYSKEYTEVLNKFIELSFDKKNKYLSEEINYFTPTRFEFWPWIQYSDSYGSEPDLLIYGKINDEDALLLIEAKYRSDKSSFPDDEDKKISDQLGREYESLEFFCYNNNIKKFFLIYLTADYQIPIHSIQKTIEEYKNKKGYECIIYWNNWHNLSELIKTDSDNYLKDAYLMLKRFGLIKFSGFIKLMNYFFDFDDLWIFTKNHISFFKEDKNKFTFQPYSFNKNYKKFSWPSFKFLINSDKYYFNR